MLDESESDALVAPTGSLYGGSATKHSREEIDDFSLGDVCEAGILRSL